MLALTIEDPNTSTATSKRQVFSKNSTILGRCGLEDSNAQ